VAAGASGGVVGAAGASVGAVVAGAQDAITSPATPAADICKNLRRFICFCDIYFLLNKIERVVGNRETTVDLFYIVTTSSRQKVIEK
jgi:hypothetical protein